MADSFSQRYGFRASPEINVREDAPQEVRAGILTILYDQMRISYSEIRGVVCPVLHVFPNRDNWSEIPNVRDEVVGLLQNCDWYRIYDFCEAIYRHFQLSFSWRAEQFAERLNGLFHEHGIGWQMQEGHIVVRGAEEFEHGVGAALKEMQEAGHQTSRRELEEARRDLSRRPLPDITGTIQHCVAALECVARILSNDETATLGEILDRHAEQLGIPKPLDITVQKMWGYASEMARHIREGRNPSKEEAELLLGVSAAVITYLLQKDRLQ
jgi:hypothetical protein